MYPGAPLELIPNINDLPDESVFRGHKTDFRAFKVELIELKRKLSHDEELTELDKDRVILLVMGLRDEE
jgi:hypothetical protein